VPRVGWHAIGPLPGAVAGSTVVEWPTEDAAVAIATRLRAGIVVTVYGSGIPVIYLGQAPGSSAQKRSAERRGP
jgi:hypothetical protein